MGNQDPRHPPPPPPLHNKHPPVCCGWAGGGSEPATVVGWRDAGGPGTRRFGGGWSIVDDERKKPHGAIFLPLEPLDTNEAAVLRVSLPHGGVSKFKSLIGR